MRRRASNDPDAGDDRDPAATVCPRPLALRAFFLHSPWVVPSDGAEVIVMRRVLTLGLMLTALGSAFVLAQGAPAPAAAPPVDDDTEAVSPDRYAAEAGAAVNRMRGAMQKGLDQVKEARAEKDSVRLLCVNEPVTAMKGILRVGENANVDLQEAIATSETAQARREFRKIKQANAQMDDLLSRAQNCSGAGSTESTTSVELEIDENLLAIDPYYGDDAFFYDPADLLADGSTGGLGEQDGPTIRPPTASGIL